MRPCSLLNTGQIVNCWYKDVIVAHRGIIDIMLQASGFITNVHNPEHSQERYSH